MTALYRRYRPRNWRDLVGQNAIAHTLQAALTAHTVARAYLFSGPKGVGKTTIARIYSKALNCQNLQPGGEPCNVCISCEQIDQGISPDLVEIDAASHTGVNEIRERILQTLHFQPVHGQYRVYILDEAHMLSSNASNALLKTIEEPPSHIVFIFCTTEAHRMTETVRDRCWRLYFQIATDEEVYEALQHVCKQEGWQITDSALKELSKHAGGSFRDGIQMLDMVQTTYGTNFDEQAVTKHLGITSTMTLQALLTAVEAHDRKAVLLALKDAREAGADSQRLIGTLLGHWRDQMLTSIQAGSSPQPYQDYLESLQYSADRIRRGMREDLVLELLLLRICDLRDSL